MLVSRFSALVIQGGHYEIQCISSGPDEKTGKWAGTIHSCLNGKPYDELIKTDAVFESSDKAVEEMAELVEKIRSVEILD